MAEKKDILEKSRDYRKRSYYILLLLYLFAFLAILKATASFSIPLMIAIFLSLVSIPIIQKLHSKLRLPWLLGMFITLIFFIVLIGVITRVLQTSALSIIDAYPRYEARCLSIYSQLASRFNLSYDEGKSLIENLLAQLRIRQALQNLAISFSGSAIGLLRNIGIVFLLYTFLLIEANEFQTKISLAFEGKIRHRVRSIIVNVIIEITRFFSIKFAISLATGLLVYGGTLVIGLDFPLVWAFIAFLLNFIPTFGSAISCLLTVFFAFMQFFPTWPPIFWTAILMVSVNFILGNVIEPRIVGDNLGISPFFILVSLSVWGWIWGFVGMILAVPFVVCVKIICENVDTLEPVAILIGNKKSAKRHRRTRHPRTTGKPAPDRPS